MKKLIMILAVVALTVTFTSSTYAQGGKMKKMKQLKTNFVDLNGDGICDNIGTTTPTQLNTRLANSANFVDADGDGVCDNQGTGLGNGKKLNFVDADGDGICDNQGTGLGNGKKLNFVDADGDGVCDNAGNPLKKQLRDGTGTGTGNQNGKKRHGNR